MDRTFELMKMAKEGNQDAKEQLIKENLGLVWAVARRFAGRGYDIEDLYQIGCIGLMKCIDKFDLSYNVKLSTYAVPMIGGEIKRFLRDDGMIKVSRTYKEIAYKVQKQRERILNETGIEPKLSELAQLLEVEEEEIVASLEANVEVESIHKTVYEKEGNTVSLMDRLANEKDENKELLDRIVVEELLSHLDETQETLIRLRYYENKTQTEIAKQLGISQVQVSRMEKKILEQLRQWEVCGY